jgi:hypothetical protein
VSYASTLDILDRLPYLVCYYFPPFTRIEKKKKQYLEERNNSRRTSNLFDSDHPPFPDGTGRDFTV